jgi:hypothetical protein
LAGGLDARDIDRVYRGKMRAAVDDDDHRVYVWWLDGRAVIRTELSTPFSSIGSSLVGEIARAQLRLPRGAPQLRELVACTMTCEQWWAHVASIAAAGSRRLL